MARLQHHNKCFKIEWDSSEYFSAGNELFESVCIDWWWYAADCHAVVFTRFKVVFKLFLGVVICEYVDHTKEIDFGSVRGEDATVVLLVECAVFLHD